jgi:hypothetical protein
VAALASRRQEARRPGGQDELEDFGREGGTEEQVAGES